MSEPTVSEIPPNQPPQDSLGIECPKCGCRHLPVIYTRQRSQMVMRRRECRHCGHRILTYEKNAASTN